MFRSRPPHAYSPVRRTAVGLALGIAAALLAGQVRTATEAPPPSGARGDLVWISVPIPAETSRR
jgi:hypothetical protein